MSHSNEHIKEFEMRTLTLSIFMILYSVNSSAVSRDDVTKNNVLNYLKSTISTINKNLPAQVDRVTQFDSVWVSDNKIVQKYTILSIQNSKTIATENLKEQMQISIRNEFCTQPSKKVARDLNIPLVLNYSAVNGEFLFEVEVSGDDCLYEKKNESSVMVRYENDLKI